MTYNNAQGTMGRVKKGGLAPSGPFSPSRPPLHANFHWERETSVYEAGNHQYIISDYCVVPENIHTPSPLTEDLLICTRHTQQDFPFQGVFDDPLSP